MEKNKYKIFIMLFILIITILLCFFILSKPKNTKPIVYSKIENIPEDTTTEDNAIEETQVEEQFDIVDTSDIPETYKGFPVIGKIVIEKIGVDHLILDDNSNEALDAGVIKFWGADINEKR